MYPGGLTGPWSAGDNYSTFCVSNTDPESERVHARIKDNAINKIYNITNNAVGSSLILTWTDYAECRFVLPGHFGVFIEIQHTEAKKAGRNPRLQGYQGQDKVSSKLI